MSSFNWQDAIASAQTPPLTPEQQLRENLLQTARRSEGNITSLFSGFNVLGRAVANGEITQPQADALLPKIRAAHQAIRNVGSTQPIEHEYSIIPIDRVTTGNRTWLTCANGEGESPVWPFLLNKQGLLITLHQQWRFEVLLPVKQRKNRWRTVAVYGGSAGPFHGYLGQASATMTYLLNQPALSDKVLQIEAALDAIGELSYELPVGSYSGLEPHDDAEQQFQTLLAANPRWATASLKVTRLW